jgi:hypothetical protein
MFNKICSTFYNLSKNCTHNIFGAFVVESWPLSDNGISLEFSFGFYQQNNHKVTLQLVKGFYLSMITSIYSK